MKTTLITQHPRLKARVMRFTTTHGDVTTPTFMPVGTRAGVNVLSAAECVETGSQIILGGNTYHMLVAPGMEIIRQAGGMHAFMAWQGPMLTDSGGFQVFSLATNEQLCVIDEEGAHFRHPESGRTIDMTPEISIQTQKTIGADIIMAFDQCTPIGCTREVAELAMARTHRWLLQSIAAHQAQTNNDYGIPQALFGIIQGGQFADLREQSTEFILQQPLDGIAIGGAVIGFDMLKTVEIVRSVVPALPDNKIRYTMGVGLNPQDLIDVVEQGIDVFDCVAPTRNARHGSLYCGEIVDSGDWIRFQSEFSHGCLQIKKSCYADDPLPIMPGCECYTCQHYSRAELRYLYKQKAIVFSRLACLHNIHVMQAVCQRMREKITCN